MERQATENLLRSAQQALHEIVDAAGDFTDETLDKRIIAFDDREYGVRQLLYGAGNHMREHATHIAKILRATGATAGTPTEAQLILGQAAQALGELYAVLLRLSDSSLDDQFEDTTIRQVLEHVVEDNESRAAYLRQAEL